MDKRSQLKKLLTSNNITVAPGAYDALSARMIYSAGFQSIYVTGFGVTASLLGKPDLGLISLEEMVNHLRRINAAVPIPIVADGESGFGNAVNTMRAVQEYESAGIAGLHIEDQCVPKTARPDGLPQIVSMEEHVEKIRAAIEARSNPDFLIIARTDALQRRGVEEAIRRGNAYAQAGADMIFVHGVVDRAELELIIKEIHAPQLVNYSTFRERGPRPLPSISELAELGFKLVIIPGELLFSAAKAMQSVLNAVKNNNTLEGSDGQFIESAAFFAAIELGKYEEFEKKYLIKQH
jgi:2-methylisocitrate lyase-like PEP mutase family enzyme